MATARFPWDSLKAESLRAVSRDLGGLPGRRDEMIAFLKAVEEQGLEAAVEMETRTALEQKAPTKMDVTPAASTDTPGLKRSRQPVVSDYNTRHRDKRARVSDPGPGFRRKAGRKSNGPMEASVHSPKKPKSKAAADTNKGRRTIFDGVVLPRFLPFADKEKDKTDAVLSNGVPPAEQGEENGAADQAPEGPEDPRVESSLASSNKENEHESPSQASGNDTAVTAVTPGDATGSPPSQRVLENIVEVAAPVADEDMDAEGEMVAEHEHEPEVAERQHAPLTVQAEIAQQSPGDGTQVEQTVTPAVENGHAL